MGWGRQSTCSSVGDRDNGMGESLPVPRWETGIMGWGRQSTCSSVGDRDNGMRETVYLFLGGRQG